MNNICITLLTGARPDLLKETLINLPTFLFKNMFALLNGNDKESRFILQSYCIPFISTSEIKSIGDNISFLTKEVKNKNKKYWLHIEDDWKFIYSENWLQKAKLALQESYQVRLRHISEKVLHKHMITGQIIEWQDLPNFTLGKAHLTFNPFLMKTQEINKIFPCIGEKDAQRNALKNNLQIVSQLKPGNFYHIGDDNSLRLKTKCQI
jgi:hypothetical protein